MFIYSSVYGDIPLMASWAIIIVHMVIVSVLRSIRMEIRYAVASIITMSQTGSVIVIGKVSLSFMCFYKPVFLKAYNRTLKFMSSIYEL